MGAKGIKNGISRWIFRRKIENRR